MMNCKLFNSKSVVFFLIFSFILLYLPHPLAAEEADVGGVTGVVYEEDGTTPVVGAIVKIKDVTTGRVYESTPTDENGFFRIENVEEGIYVFGVIKNGVKFNVEEAVGIKAGEIANMVLMLKPGKKGIIGFFTSTAGIALIAVTTAAIIAGAIVIAGPTVEASPFK